MLGPIETVTVKVAFSGSAAATFSPATVSRLLREGAARAVRRTRAGELKPLVFERPYRVRFCLRRQYARDEWVRTTIGRFEGLVADGGEGCLPTRRRPPKRSATCSTGSNGRCSSHDRQRVGNGGPLR